MISKSQFLKIPLAIESPDYRNLRFQLSNQINTTSYLSVFPHINQNDYRITQLKLRCYYSAIKELGVSNSTIHDRIGVDSGIGRLLSTTSHNVDGNSYIIQRDEEEVIDTTYLNYLKEFFSFIMNQVRVEPVSVPLGSSRGIGFAKKTRMRTLTDLRISLEYLKEVRKCKTVEESYRLYTKMFKRVPFSNYISRLQPRESKLVRISDMKVFEHEEITESYTEDQMVEEFANGNLRTISKPRSYYDPIQKKKVYSRQRGKLYSFHTHSYVDWNTEVNSDMKIFVIADKHQLMDAKKRSASGLSGPISRISNLFGALITQVLGKYEKTWKLVDLETENLLLKKGKIIRCSDKVSYDQNIKSEMIRQFQYAIVTKFPVLEKIFPILMGSPVLIPYFSVFILQKILPYISSQLLSGSGFTSCLGKMLGTADSFFFNGILISEFDKALKHELRFGIKNNSDDEAAIFDESHTYVDSEYLPNTEESTYSGKLVRQDGERLYFAEIPSSALVNILVSEYSFGYIDKYTGAEIGNNLYSIAGYLLKKKSYDPNISKVMNILDEKFKLIFGYDLENYLLKICEVPDNVLDLEPYLEYVSDPSKLRWKADSNIVEQLENLGFASKQITLDEDVVELFVKETC